MQYEKRVEKYHFSLKKLLGQGSYASVYRGKTIEGGEAVAVKVIDKRIFTSSFNLKNLHSEIEIMKKVSHGNIVQLHDVYQTTNNMYIITELCDWDLAHLLKERRKLPEQQALAYLRQIMSGAKYLNSNCIIHRDLKPANILLKDGHCKISDFGFAKSTQGEEGLLKSIVGTPLYMCPQLLQKQKYSSKSDLWSIGLIYYEMLHGRTPWLAHNELQLVHAIHTQKVTYSKLISDLSRDFIARCLAIDDHQRITWEEAFAHPLITPDPHPTTPNDHPTLNKLTNTSRCLENKSAVMGREDREVENNSFLMNNTGVQAKKEGRREGLCLTPKCMTPKMHKNISEIRLKKVEALTPKASFTNINNRLREVCALNGGKEVGVMRGEREVGVMKGEREMGVMKGEREVGAMKGEVGAMKGERRRRNLTMQLECRPQQF